MLVQSFPRDLAPSPPGEASGTGESRRQRWARSARMQETHVSGWRAVRRAMRASVQWGVG